MSGNTEIATYLYPEDAGLADEYLTAAAAYLDAYARVLGPYPFRRFSIGENFFASGLGMPSYTLLGAGSIRRHYTQPYALVMRSCIPGSAITSSTTMAETGRKG